MASNSKEISSGYFPLTSMLSVHPIRKQSYTFNDIISVGFAFECFEFSSRPGVDGTTELSASLIANFYVNRMKIGRVVEGSDGERRGWRLVVWVRCFLAQALASSRFCSENPRLTLASDLGRGNFLAMTDLSGSLVENHSTPCASGSSAASFAQASATSLPSIP